MPEEICTPKFNPPGVNGPLYLNELSGIDRDSLETLVADGIEFPVLAYFPHDCYDYIRVDPCDVCGCSAGGCTDPRDYIILGTPVLYDLGTVGPYNRSVFVYTGIIPGGVDECIFFADVLVSGTIIISDEIAQTLGAVSQLGGAPILSGTIDGSGFPEINITATTCGEVLCADCQGGFPFTIEEGALGASIFSTITDAYIVTGTVVIDGVPKDAILLVIDNGATVEIVPDFVAQAAGVQSTIGGVPILSGTLTIDFGGLTENSLGLSGDIDACADIDDTPTLNPLCVFTGVITNDGGPSEGLYQVKTEPGGVIIFGPVAYTTSGYLTIPLPCGDDYVFEIFEDGNPPALPQAPVTLTDNLTNYDIDL